MDDSTMSTCEMTSLRENAPEEIDTDASPQVPIEEEINVAAAEIASMEDTSGRRQSGDQQRGRNILIASGTETAQTDTIRPPPNTEIGLINDEDFRFEKEDTVASLPVAPEGNPYDRSVKYLHKHSLPSLFQYITINLAYQRPEDAIEFMIDEVRKRSRGKQEETKMFG